jgi:hypothetical protein
MAISQQMRLVARQISQRDAGTVQCAILSQHVV